MFPYQEIISCIQSDFSELDKNLHSILDKNSNYLTPKLFGYLFSSSKRIRSTLVFLLTRALNKKIGSYQLKIASATELIHNATLIHDDIIDDSPLRRDNITLNYEFDSKLAVIAGDFLLSLALNELLETNDTKPIGIFTESLKQICSGEITQYFEKNKIISIEEYIEKSKRKTAMLFKSALVSSVSDIDNFAFLKNVEEFAINFGIAFQIRDDLINVMNIDNSKPFQDDIQNGIYTAPVIYLVKDNPNILHNSSEEIILKIKKSDSIDKTKWLMQKHINLAIDSIDFLEDNLYKQSIIKLCDYICEVEKVEN